MDDRGDGELIIIVPVKSFAEAKGRLAPVLSPESRTRLSRDMFVRTLGILNRAQGPPRILVVSRDKQVLSLARKRHAWALWEANRGLNAALEQATRVAVANGARAVLILPADLPGLTKTDVERIVDLGRQPPCVVIAPAQRDQGTNALLVNPAGLFEYAFGEASFVEHRRRAENAGARVHIYNSNTIEFDVDLPDDLKKNGMQFHVDEHV